MALNIMEQTLLKLMDQAWQLTQEASLDAAKRETTDTIVEERVRIFGKALDGLVLGYKVAGGPAKPA